MMCAEITSWTRTVLEPGAAVAEGWFTVFFGYMRHIIKTHSGMFVVNLQYFYYSIKQKA